MPRPKCRHGNTLFKLQGCAKCCQPLLDGGNLLNVLDVDAAGLLALILDTYPEHAALVAACEKAKARKVDGHTRPATVAPLRASQIPASPTKGESDAQEDPR